MGPLERKEKKIWSYMSEANLPDGEATFIPMEMVIRCLNTETSWGEGLYLRDLDLHLQGR